MMFETNRSLPFGGVPRERIPGTDGLGPQPRHTSAHSRIIHRSNSLPMSFERCPKHRQSNNQLKKRPHCARTSSVCNVGTTRDHNKHAGTNYNQRPKISTITAPRTSLPSRPKLHENKLQCTILQRTVLQRVPFASAPWTDLRVEQQAPEHCSSCDERSKPTVTVDDIILGSMKHTMELFSNLVRKESVKNARDVDVSLQSPKKTLKTEMNLDELVDNKTNLETQGQADNDSWGNNSDGLFGLEFIGEVE